MLLRRAIAQAVSERIPTAAARVEPKSAHVRFVVGEVTLEHVFSELKGRKERDNLEDLGVEGRHPSEKKNMMSGCELDSTG